MGFQVTEDMGLEVYGEWKGLGAEMRDGWVPALQSFVDRHNLRPAVDEAPGPLDSAPTGPVGVFRHAKGSINLAMVREWHNSMDDGEVDVYLDGSVTTTLRDDDAACFIDIFSRWEVR